MGNTTGAQAVFSIAGIKQFLDRTYRSKFVRNVAVVASGTAGAQAIVTRPGYLSSHNASGAECELRGFKFTYWVRRGV